MARRFRNDTPDMHITGALVPGQSAPVMCEQPESLGLTTYVHQGVGSRRRGAVGDQLSIAKAERPYLALALD